MSKKTSLLSPAPETPQRLKMYLYGETGTGKTITALNFPNPAVVDTERGTDYYGKDFKFERIQSSDPKLLLDVIEELLEDPKDFKTFVIDPFSMIYDTLVSNHEVRLKLKNNNPNYVLLPSDYRFVKSEVKYIIQKLLALDMNIIVTAKSKIKYAEGEFMKAEGQKADGPDSLPYMFDVVLKLSKKEDKFWATVEKDRSKQLPKEFEFSYKSFVQYLGVDVLEKAADVNIQKENLNQNRKTKIKLGNKEVYTAGVSAEMIEKLQKLIPKFISEENLKTKLKDDFAIDHVFDLRNDEAEVIIKELTTSKK